MNRRRYLGLATAAMSGLAGCLADTEYTVSAVAVDDIAAPLALDVTPVDRSVTVDSPGTLALTLRNTSEKPIEIRTTGVWPFGMLGLAPPGEHGPDAILLLSDQYEETDRVEATASSAHLDNTPITDTLDGGESVSAQYEIHGERVVDTGTHTLRGFFDAVPLSYRDPDADGWTQYHPDVTVDLSKQSLLS
ncbi:hypothetical protein ACAH01_05875 [Halomicrobium sp. HM KBTZ05]|uniref:DUF8130 domain-containing protein n=1 Tax=Halomicrobium mukohataei TaxID=57705 RepID=A0A847UDL4_9EURY|nr:hypothetical protein [Halomicrobium mukohataei]NLV11259.1 hypothetical protein [Halomicrobium mukohataei]